MALSHILHAITAEADADIHSLQAKHVAAMSALQSEHQRSIEHVRHAIALKKMERMRSLRSRAEGRVRMKVRHATLGRKQEILNSVYEDVISALQALPSAKTEAMLRQWIDALPTKGTLLPSVSHAALIRALSGDRHSIGASINAAGGFLYIGATQDRDYTYEFLVREVLRPSTEIAIAHQMFGIA